MSLIDDIRSVIDMQPKSTQGYIVVCAPKGWQSRPDPRFRIVFLKRRQPDHWAHEFTGGSLPNAEIFDTYQEASDAGLTYQRAHPGECRIIRVQTQAPLTMSEHYPITLIDALAEL